MPRSYNLRNVRAFLTEGFSDDELRRFCFDIPEYRSVHGELVPNISKAQIIDRLIEHAEQKMQIEVLLSHAQKLNPARYEEHKPYEELPQSVFSKTPQIEILFLAANPSDTTRLRLDQEIREIDETLRGSKYGSKFNIRQHWAVRAADLQNYLLRHRPGIVHFSGHGSQSSEIILEDNLGNSYPVPAHALSELFSLLKDNIRCVVLNACYSEKQSRAIAEHIDCVIGMSSAIEDLAAIRFARGFYRALGYGKDMKTAFDLGCLEIDLEGLEEQDKPKLLALKCKPQEILLVDGD